MSEPIDRIAYTVPEVAAMCKVSEEAIRQMIHRGEIIAKRFGGERNLRIGRVALEQFFTTPEGAAQTATQNQTATNSNQNSNDTRPSESLQGFKRGPKAGSRGGTR